MPTKWWAYCWRWWLIDDWMIEWKIEFWILNFIISMKSNLLQFSKMTFFIIDYKFENTFILHIYRLYFVILNIYILFRIIKRLGIVDPESYRKWRILNQLIDRKFYIGKFLIEFESVFNIEKKIRFVFLDSIQDL